MTFRDEMNRLEAKVEALPGLVRWLMRRRLRRIERKLEAGRNAALRRYWRS